MITLSGDSRTIGPLIFNATRSRDTGFMSSMPIATQPSLYRIHPASFRDGNGDGVGDAHGMLAALPYLKALSIDGLLLPQTLAPETEAAVTGEGLTLWYADEVNRVRNAAAPQRFAHGALALDVMPFSAEKLVAVLHARRASLADSLWSTGDADQPRVVSRWGRAICARRRLSDAAGDVAGADLPVSGRRAGLPHAAGLQDPRGAQTPMPWHEAPNRSPPAKSAGISRWRSNTARWPSAANSTTATPPYVTARRCWPCAVRRSSSAAS